MQSTNGCCGVSHSEAGSRLAGLTGKPEIKPDYETDPRTDFGSSCSTTYFRGNASEVLDLVGLGKTIAICVDLAPDADPVAVTMPWADYRDLISMRAKIAAITGGMQPQRAG